MSRNIYICVHFTSTINTNIFSNFLEGRIHFPGYFSGLHRCLSNLGKFLNAPSTKCSKPGLGSVLLLLFILKSRKMKKIGRSNSQLLPRLCSYSVIFLCFPVPPQEPCCFHNHLLISHQHSSPIRKRASLVFWTDKE